MKSNMPVDTQLQLELSGDFSPFHVETGNKSGRVRLERFSRNKKADPHSKPFGEELWGPETDSPMG
jgi:hypothetical protein